MPGEDVITRFDNAGVEMSLMIEGGELRCKQVVMLQELVSLLA